MSHEMPDTTENRKQDLTGNNAPSGSYSGGYEMIDPAMPTPPPKKKKKKKEDPELARMNRELNALLGTEISKEAGSNKRTYSQMKALKKERRQKIVSVPLIILILIVALAAGGYGGYRYLLSSGRKSLLAHKQVEGIEITAPEDAVVSDDGETVTYEGKTYRRNNDIISILALGIDEKSENPEEHAIGNNGQADTIFVAALNIVTGEVTLINISRDSLVDVDVYDTNGDYAGTEQMQICLSYAYGDGEETSCQNTLKSVSRLMYGMPIDAYASITVPAISVLNDAIGGVTVTVREDIGSGENALKKGDRVTLMGKQVNAYLIRRDRYDKEANNNRMARQRQYLVAFMNRALSQIRNDFTTVFTLYQAITSYMTTDLSAARMTYLASLVMDGKFREQDIRTIGGSVTLEEDDEGQQHAEYHVDDKELYQTILDVYYTEVS